MSSTAVHYTYSHAEFRRHWTVVTVAGLLGMTYFTCIATAPRTKFLLELGATPFDFGLMAGLSSGMLIFQIVSAILTNRLRRRKRFWIPWIVAERLLFLGVLVAPTLFGDERLRLWWIIGVLALDGMMANTGAPMWFSWMSDLVPHDSLNLHWAVRQRFIAAGNIVAQLSVAFLFHHFERSGRVIEGFTVIGLGGLVLGVTDILLFTLIPEPETERYQELSVRAALVEPLRNANFRPYLLFRAYWTFAIMVSAPFMGPYLISEVKLSTLIVQLTFITSSLGIVLASRLWGMLCDNYGHRPALLIVASLKPLIVLPYVLVPPIPALAVPIFAVMALLDGAANAGGQIATQGVMLKDTPRRNRAMYIGATNFLALGVAGGIAPIVAGSLIQPLTDVFAFDTGPYHFTGYHLIFVLSFLLRAGALPLATRLREPESVSARKVVAYLKRADTLRAIQAVARLRDARSDQTRAVAAMQLGRMRSPLAEKELIRALEDPHAKVRRLAADALGRLALREAVPALGAALGDPDRAVQIRAARALGLIGGDESVRLLSDSLLRDDAQALGEILRSLNRLDSPLAAPALERFLERADQPRLRPLAAELLHNLRKRERDA